MNILLGEDWKICSDERNLILYRKQELKGEERKGDGWGIVGYYCELSHLISELVDLSTYAIEAETLAGLAKGIKRFKKQLLEQTVVSQGK